MDIELMRSKQARKITLFGFIVNSILALFKLIAGIIGKSGAMIADAVHSFSDFLTDIVVLIGFKFTSRPEDQSHNYGHGKYETLATLIISFILVLVGFQIFKSGVLNAMQILRGEVFPKPGLIALIAAGVSIVLKELLYWQTILVGKKIKSSAVIANAWHHRSDAFSSIGTMIGIGGAIFLGQHWTILDPLASIIVSIFIFKVAYDILIPSINELVEKSLNDDDKEAIITMLKEFTEVKEYHKLRMRKVGIKSIIECHIMVDENLNIKDAHDIATAIETKIKDRFGPSSIITIHIEPYLSA